MRAPGASGAGWRVRSIVDPAAEGDTRRLALASSGPQSRLERSRAAPRPRRHESHRPLPCACGAMRQ